MSERTVESRLARWRLSDMEERRRERVRVCSCKVERWRVRLFCFRAEGVVVRWFVSCSMRDSRYGVLARVMSVYGERLGKAVTFSRRVWIWDSVFFSSSVGLGGMLGVEAKWE